MDLFVNEAELVFAQALACVPLMGPNPRPEVVAAPPCGMALDQHTGGSLGAAGPAAAAGLVTHRVAGVVSGCLPWIGLLLDCGGIPDPGVCGCMRVFVGVSLPSSGPGGETVLRRPPFPESVKLWLRRFWTA
mmetsp:Transcript_31362/g.75123  ORF Transcript_31362/g.75123 Transcript_31362/m.75123 type:complete len:132 (-) Transcript_31362:174-569(-)